MEAKNRNMRKVIPAVNIKENDKEVILEAEMVGLGKDEVGVDVSEDTLTITGSKKERNTPKGYELIYSERCDYEYERAFVLGNEVDRGKINAKYDNGILRITLPKSEEVQPKKIEIQ